MLSIGGAGRDYAPSFLTLEDGIVVVGMTSSYGLGDGGGNRDGSHDFLAVKLDLDGNLVWGRTIGGPEDERGSYSVRPDNDGGLLLTGTSRSFGSGKTDLFIVKLDSQGNLVWSKAVGGVGAEGGMTTLAVADGYIAIGDTDTFGAGKKDLLVVKLQPDGTLAWAKTYGGLEDDVGSGIAQVDGGYILGGTIWSFGAGEADSGLIKIDTVGKVQWAKTIGGEKGEGVNWDGVRITEKGGIAFGDKTGSFEAKGNGALFGIEVNSAGDMVWSTMVDGPLEDAGWTMNQTTDGFILGGKLTDPQNGGDVIFIKLDQAGQYQWARKFGEAGLDEIEEIKPIEGGYLMAGVTRMLEPAGDFLIAKVNGDGYIGGTSDPIYQLEPRIVKPITPQVSGFSPKVSDITNQIAVIDVTPNVTTPQLDIHVIYRYE